MNGDNSALIHAPELSNTCLPGLEDGSGPAPLGSSARAAHTSGAKHQSKLDGLQHVWCIIELTKLMTAGETRNLLQVKTIMLGPYLREHRGSWLIAELEAGRAGRLGMGIATEKEYSRPRHNPSTFLRVGSSDSNEGEYTSLSNGR